MTHVSEKLDVMDTITSFRKQKNFSISRLLLVFLLVFFVLVIVATALLTYYLTPRVKTIVQSECVISTTSISSSTSTSELLSVKEVIEDVKETTEVTTDVVTTQKVTTNKPDVNLRLPKSIKPSSYQLYLLPFIFEGNFTFHGNVSINITVEDYTSSITLHADELEIEESSVEVLSEDGRSLQVLQLTNDTERNFFVVHLDEELLPGSSYEIRMEFVGILGDNLQGFYRSSYMVNNTKRWIAVTQFQPTDARKAFPCFDEPAMKAKFQVNIGRPKEMSAISNMPKFKSTPVENFDGYLWDHFETSVPMSTYLVAFLVSDFDHLTNNTVSIWFRKTASNQAAFSLKIAPALLRYYEDFFQIKFPLPKIDMVALPDFQTGAMENWGLITFRESVLLYEPETSTGFNKQTVAIVVAHELAHQWFGNLVSPLWWDDIWLNEGFASFMEFSSVDAVCPELKTLDQFVVYVVQSVLTLDALKSSHPVSVAVGNPNEINNIFDRISYGKGAAIIRMMEHFLTSPVFRAALTNYLNDRKYSNAEQDDLWRFLTNQAHQKEVLEPNMSVKEIMDSWTLQTGFPLIKVTRNYENTINFKQERFLVAGNSSGTDPTLWWVPITYMSKTDQNENRIWMKSVSEVQVEVNIPKDDWLLVNVNQTGYYRVNYDHKNWELLIKQLNSKKGHLKIDPKNRAQLLDDSFNLANGGYLDYAIALNVTKYLVYERESVPWGPAFITFDYLENIFSKTGHFDLYKKYVLHLIQGIYKDLGFHEKPTDTSLTLHLRTNMLLKVCKLGYKDCIINSINEFQKWRTSADPDQTNPISPNLRGIVYCHAIKAGGQEEWDFAWERYLRTEVATERELLMSGLGCSREPWILRRYLEWAITEESGIRKHDSNRVFATVATESIVGGHIAYNFLKSDWDRIEKYMGSSPMLMSGIIRACINLFPTQEELDDIKNFVQIRKKEFSVVGRLINQLVEKAEANLIWRKTNLNRIISWLSSQEYS